MLRAIIIDDEESGIETIRILASRNPELIRIVASTLKPTEGIKLIEDYKPDVIFLDISMPDMNGFELLTRLDFRGFKLIFTTAHREYAIEAIKKRAFDYLLKPIDNDDFKKCLINIHGELEIRPAQISPSTNSLIEVQLKDGIHFLKQKEIIRLEASRSYTVFYLENGKKLVASKSLIEFESKLDPNLFYRCHKSHIINLNKVQKFINHDGFFALMSDDSMPDISKNNKEIFLERLKKI